MNIKRISENRKYFVMDVKFWLIILTVLLAVVLAEDSHIDTACVPIEKCSRFNNIKLRNGVTSLLRCRRDLAEVDTEPHIYCPPGSVETSATFKPQFLPNNSVCGIQINDNMIQEITDLEEHPWLGLLRYNKEYGWDFYCAGALISSRYVLTAAHCVSGEDIPPTWNLTQVRLGEWNITSSNDCIEDYCSLPVVDVDIEEQIVHEKYDPNDKQRQNDIALLKLSREIEFTDSVKPICLPLTEDQRSNLFAGYDMEVTGFGKVYSKSMSQVKRKYQVTIVNVTTCRNVYRSVGQVITEKQVCAGGWNDRFRCYGDPGGPLLAQLSRNWMLLGVESFTPTPCGTSRWPAVYTRVGYYINWILAKINS